MLPKEKKMEVLEAYDLTKSHSVILSAKASATFERTSGSSRSSVPRARAATNRATVWWSTPVSWAADR
jgi:hypothetical protein